MPSSDEPAKACKDNDRNNHHNISALGGNSLSPACGRGGASSAFDGKWPPAQAYYRGKSGGVSAPDGKRRNGAFSVYGGGKPFAKTCNGGIPASSSRNDVSRNGDASAPGKHDISRSGDISNPDKCDISRNGDISASGKRDISNPGKHNISRNDNVSNPGKHNISRNDDITASSKGNISCNNDFFAPIERSISHNDNISAPGKHSVHNDDISAPVKCDVSRNGNIFDNISAAGKLHVSCNSNNVSAPAKNDISCNGDNSPSSRKWPAQACKNNNSVFGLAWTSHPDIFGPPDGSKYKSDKDAKGFRARETLWKSSGRKQDATDCLEVADGRGGELESMEKDEGREEIFRGTAFRHALTSAPDIFGPLDGSECKSDKDAWTSRVEKTTRQDSGRRDVAGCLEVDGGKEGGEPMEEDEEMEEIFQGSTLGHAWTSGLDMLGPGIGWERLLPRGELRVLLVENDDCTRHVVAALLRNCGYKVSSACNGLEAWRILEDPDIHCDLVLTEVIIPCLSGISLLCKVLTHQPYKHIPVIMMSAHDSMGIVFKCLSKGAVDFLVKPVRKNELKNLWQHVWRRCHNSSGSGNGAHNALQLKGGAAVSGNNTGSNHGNDDVSSGLNAMDGSDNGSGTQSSWTKRVVEIESPNCIVVQDKVLGSHMEEADTLKVEKNQRKKSIGTLITEGSTVQRGLVGIDRSEGLEIGTRKRFHPELRDVMAPRGFKEPSVKGIELVGSIASCKNNETNKDKEEGGSGLVAQTNEDFRKEKADTGSSSSPALLELTLKRPCNGDSQGGGGQERRTLLHSGSSAFSRYNASSSFTSLPKNVSSLPVGYGGGGTSKEEEALKVGANGPTGVQDEVLPISPQPTTPLPLVTCDGMFRPYSSRHPSFFSQSNAPQHPTSSPQTGEKAPEGIGLHHHHHHNTCHHHHHHHYHGHAGRSSEGSNIGGNVPQCGSSNAANGPDGNTGSNSNGYASNGNGNGNASVTGSSNGSNGNDAARNVCNQGIVDSSQHVNVGATTVTAGNVETSLVVEADQSRVARQAALTKFRQKRKERCFEKKVRYQSRKKLAEQRPRVRGQFVRQISSTEKQSSALS